RSCTGFPGRRSSDRRGRVFVQGSRGHPERAHRNRDVAFEPGSKAAPGAARRSGSVIRDWPNDPGRKKRMNRIQFGEGACEKTRKYLDSYISNELLVETNHDVLHHLESCPACSAELDARTQLRTRLKAAVNTQSVPPE